MREIDERALRAQRDVRYLDEFIREYETFILHTAHKGAGRYVSKRDDQWSIALAAFHEAVKSYDFEKGAFLPLAETVIRRRLYDYSRKEARRSCEVLIDSFTAEKTDPEEEVTAVKLEVMKKTSENQGQEARLEIQTLSEILSAYGISFPELAEASPKAAKTKKSCGIAVMFLAGNPLLMKEMKRSGNLPLKLLEKKLDLPRKILERHRKYIIAGAEIIAGDFPILSEYLSFMRKENLR